MSTISTTVLADNAYGTIAVALATTDTSLTFTTGHGARFPAVASPNVLYCCLLNSSNVLEEIQITAHIAGADTATIVRAAGGTSAKTWAVGDRIEARISNAVLDGITSFLQSGTGAVARTIQSKGRDFINVADTGAKSDGVTDDWSSINTYVTGNSNVAILFQPGSTTMVSQALPFRNNVGYACVGGFATIKATAGSTDNVIGEASPVAAYSNVYMENIIVDGNRVAVAYNTRNGGLTDDAYQNGIRMNQVSNSTFRNVRVQNSVMNGINVYNNSNDNEFLNCWATNIGKSTSVAGGVASYNGIFVEGGSNRNVFIRPHIDTTKDNGIWENSHGSASRDNWYIFPYVNSPTLDGIRIGNENVTGAQQPLQRTKIIGGLVGGVVGLAAEGLRIYHSGVGANAGTVDYPYVAGLTCSGGAQDGINISAQVNSGIFVNNHCLSNSRSGIRNSGVDCLFAGNVSLLNVTNQWVDAGTRTIEYGNQFDTATAAVNGSNFRLIQVADKTADFAIVVPYLNRLYTNRGAAGGLTLTLPSGATIGDSINFYVAAAFTMNIAANAGASIEVIGGATGTTNNVAGSSLTLTYAAANKWVASQRFGTWVAF